MSPTDVAPSPGTGLDPAAREAVENYLKNPTGRGILGPLNSSFWDLIYATIRERASGGKSESLGLKNVAPLFDWGLLDVRLLEKGETDVTAFREKDTPVDDPNLFTFSEWIEADYHKILSFDKRSFLTSEIARMDADRQAKQRALEERQEERRSLFSEYLEAALNKKGLANSPVLQQTLERFGQVRRMDELYYQITLSQKRISGGQFMDLQKKRELAEVDKEFKSLQKNFQSLLGELQDPAASKKVKETGDAVNKLMDEMIALDAKREKTDKELNQVVQSSTALSPQEVERRINESMDYFKDLMTLSSKRLHAEPQSAWTGKAKPCTRAALKAVLKHVEEYDPGIFKNERIKFLGLPKFVILPGFGKGIYDWKNNAVLVPTFSPASLEESVYAGVIEYRIDMDDDKKLMTSYNQLPDNKDVKSMLRLREKFAKDYTTFMTHETKGYKVLSTESRGWLHREIAPRRFEIKSVRRYDPVTMPVATLEKLKADLSARIKDGSATADEIYGMGLIETHEEAFDRAIQHFKQALEKSPALLDCLYNLGITYMKKHMKKEASEVFGDFIKKNPPNWWTGVCQEYLMRLR